MIVTSKDDLTRQSVSHDENLSKFVYFKNLRNIPQFAVCELPPKSKITPHVHPDMHEIFYVEEGRGKFYCTTGNVTKEVTIRKECTVVVEPGETHWITSDHDSILKLVYFGLVNL